MGATPEPEKGKRQGLWTGLVWIMKDGGVVEIHDQFEVYRSLIQEARRAPKSRQGANTSRANYNIGNDYSGIYETGVGQMVRSTRV